MIRPVSERGTLLLVGLVGLSGCADDPILPPGGEALEVVVSGLVQPVLVAAAPGDADRIFVVEKAGRIRVVRDGELLAQPFLDIDSETGHGDEEGLLGLAFDPEYASNGAFYVNHTDNSGRTRILRFGVSGNPDVADATSLDVLLTIDQPFSNHNGGHIAFGPDGMLYIGMGDGGAGGDPLDHGQTPSTLLGSMLRIAVGPTGPYSIPPDNPFVGHATIAPETWAYGLRNPWRFSFDRMTGDLLIGDVGQRDIEEISYQPASSDGGENYGWNLLEGTRCFVDDPCDPTGTVLPIHEYDHDEGCSITGGYVYRGEIATLRHRYFYADFCGGWVRSFRIEDGQAVDHFDHSDDFGAVSTVASFGEDADGELYIVSLNGTVYRVMAPS